MVTAFAILAMFVLGLPIPKLITGESGGGYVCAGAMVQLASKDEGHLVKLAVPIIAILDDYEFTSRESMMTDEAERVVMMQKIWQTIGGPDFEAKQSAGDPLLFPGWKLKNWEIKVLQCFRQGGCKSAGKDASNHYLGI